jgi:lycopene beta-cyclase
VISTTRALRVSPHPAVAGTTGGVRSPAGPNGPNGPNGPTAPHDVAVVGGGPAGRALAGACAARGLRTALVDVTPDRPWRITYGAFTADLPELPASAVAARARGRTVAVQERDLGWEYTVLDVPGLRAHLDAGLTGVTVVAGRAVGHTGDGVALADGSTLRAQVVVDAGGHRQPLSRRASGTAAEQTAYGVVVDEATAAPVVAPGEALFMDWRPPRDDPRDGWPTFLYAVPLGSGRVLLEETSLARRPGLPMPELRDRLLARLKRHGIAVPADAEVERVHFPVDTARHRARDVLGFGAAAPLMHPATGFSVAATLRLAPAAADALAAHLPGDPRGALAAADAVLWPPSARAVHLLRRRGLEALLRMPPAKVPAFFDVFFGLPDRHRWTYLTRRDDLGATVAAMNVLFGRAGWGLRRRLVAPALRPVPATVAR